MRDASSFGYRISQTSTGWSWMTFDPNGGVQHRGEAPTRAIAAAYVIRCLAMDWGPAASAA